MEKEYLGTGEGSISSLGDWEVEGPSIKQFSESKTWGGTWGFFFKDGLAEMTVGPNNMEKHP